MDPDITVSVFSWPQNAEACLCVRREVFVQEQGVPEEVEVDGQDPECVHVLAVDPQGAPVATGRLLPDGRIGRMAVRRAWRRKGIGTRILRALEAEANRAGIGRVVLYAQAGAMEFYGSLGYRPVGPGFWEAGIPHRKMIKELGGENAGAPRRS